MFVIGSLVVDCTNRYNSFRRGAVALRFTIHWLVLLRCSESRSPWVAQRGHAQFTSLRRQSGVQLVIPWFVQRSMIQLMFSKTKHCPSDVRGCNVTRGWVIVSHLQPIEFYGDPFAVPSIH